MRRSTSLTTSPRTPPSSTSALLPAPSMVIGTPASRQRGTSSVSWDASRTARNQSAGPPMPYWLWRLSGSSRLIPGQRSSHSTEGMARLQSGESASGNVVEAAHRHAENDIATLRGLGDDQDRLLGSRHHPHIAGAVSHPDGDILGAHGVGEVALASRLDGPEAHQIGAGEAGRVLLEQLEGARVGVRAVEGDEVADRREAGAGRPDRGGDLGGMVRVVVDHGDAVDAADDLEAARRPAEIRAGGGT